jgi:hypothetical protein
MSVEVVWIYWILVWMEWILDRLDFWESGVFWRMLMRCGFNEIIFLYLYVI